MLQQWALAIARWSSIFKPFRAVLQSGSSVRYRNLLRQWTWRWHIAQAELRGPALFFADSRHWEVEFANALRALGHNQNTHTGVSKEWVAAPEAVMCSVVESHVSASDRCELQMLHAGCGTSSLGPLLAASFPNAAVRNIDVSTSAIAAARSRCPNGLNSRCSWQVADALHLYDTSGNQALFHVVIDKGLVDSLLHAGAFAVAAYAQAAADLLVSGGIFVSVSDETHVECRLALVQAAFHGIDGLGDSPNAPSTSTLHFTLQGKQQRRWCKEQTKFDTTRHFSKTE